MLMISKENKDEEIYDSNEDDTDLKDYDDFIEELQRIIHEHPESAGMQAKFAKTILYLKEKKRLSKALENPDIKANYHNLINIVQKDIHQNNLNTSEKFKNLLKLSQMRIKMIEEAKQKEITKENSNNKSNENTASG